MGKDERLRVFLLADVLLHLSCQYGSRSVNKRKLHTTGKVPAPPYRVHYLDVLKRSNNECASLQVSVGCGLICQSFRAKGRGDEAGRASMAMLADKDNRKWAACPELHSQARNSGMMCIWSCVLYHAGLDCSFWGSVSLATFTAVSGIKLKSLSMQVASTAILLVHSCSIMLH